MKQFIKDITDGFLQEHAARVEALKNPATSPETKLLHNYKQEQILDDLKRLHDELRKDPALQQEADYIQQALANVNPNMIPQTKKAA